MERFIDYLKTFGCIEARTVAAPGADDKVSEFNTALDLVRFQDLDFKVTGRACFDVLHRESLASTQITRSLDRYSQRQQNCACPSVSVGIGPPLSKDDLYKKVKQDRVDLPRSWYLLMAELPIERALRSISQENLPVTIRVGARVLCTPIYPGLNETAQDRVIDLVFF